MSSSLFHFKQFSIRQDQTAMKVGTDGILLGAWTKVDGATQALDIGTGTGLLALMLAQRKADLQLDAVELDQGAFLQAKGNFLLSPWKDRITCHHGSVLGFLPKTPYDLIVCNPPYYRDHLDDNSPRMKARQQVSLPFDQLFQWIRLNLTREGHCSLIIPALQLPFVLAVAQEAELFLNHQVGVRTMKHKAISRFLLDFSLNPQAVVEEEFTLQLAGGSNQYTQEYIRLTREFYAFM